MLESNHFAIGFMVGLVIDVAWWYFHFDKSNLDKRFKAHEHYHIGLELGIIGTLTNQPIFIGLMVAFFLGEWTQDHKFALKSGHFKASSVIGIVLFVILLILTMMEVRLW